MVNDVSQDRLRRLAAHRDGAVLSLFLDLDPSSVPTAPARQSAVDSLLHDARRAVEDAGLDHAARGRMRDALAALSDRLAPGALPIDGARGLAVFVPGPQDAVEVLRLPAAVPTRVVLDGSPCVEPLLRLADRARWCVALVDRSVARFHLGDEDGLPLSGTLEDDVHGQRRQGGWSYGRYERSIENEVASHLHHVAGALRLSLQEQRYDRLVLAGQHTIRKELEARLDPPVRDRLEGWVDLDLSSAGPSEVLTAALPVIQEARRAHEQDVLARLAQGTATPGGHAVAGLRTTLGALSERRVEVLVLDPALTSAGARCPTCGTLLLSVQDCPADGTPMESLPDVVGAAIALAYEQAAEVLLPAAAPELTAAGGVGAVTRF